MFEPIEDPKTSKGTEPGIVMPAEDAAPIELAATNGNADLDALFDDIAPAPGADADEQMFADLDKLPEPTTPKALIPTPTPTTKEPAKEAVREIISSIVPTNDPGRVTDPALQPIRIPK